ncbi:hypothetical protein [Streptomyces sp. NPDC002156]
MGSVADALLDGADPGELDRHELPDEYLAAHLRASDAGFFGDLVDKGVRKTLHVGSAPMTEIAPDEAVVAVMTGSIIYDTVWSATFGAVPTFEFLNRYGRPGGYAARHAVPHQVLGSVAPRSMSRSRHRTPMRCSAAGSSYGVARRTSAGRPTAW